MKKLIEAISSYEFISYLLSEWKPLRLKPKIQNEPSKDDWKRLIDATFYYLTVLIVIKFIWGKDILINPEEDINWIGFPIILIVQSVVFSASFFVAIVPMVLIYHNSSMKRGKIFSMVFYSVLNLTTLINLFLTVAFFVVINRIASGKELISLQPGFDTWGSLICCIGILVIPVCLFRIISAVLRPKNKFNKYLFFLFCAITVMLGLYGNTLVGPYILSHIKHEKVVEAEHIISKSK